MKRLNWGLLLAALICVVFWAGVIILCSGCGPEFGLGFGTGAAVMAKMAEDAQSEFITAVEAVDAQAAVLNALAASYSTEGLIKPETVAAIEKVKGFKDNPWAWGAIAGWLLNSGALGAVVGRKLKKN